MLWDIQSQKFCIKNTMNLFSGIAQYLIRIKIKKNLNFDFILRPHIDSKNWFICIEIQIFCPKIHRDYHKTFYHITDSNVPIKEPLNSNEDFLDTIINIVHEDIQSLQDEIIDLDIIWGGCTIGFGSDDLKKQCIDKLSIYH